jgi:hypothetical protein
MKQFFTLVLMLVASVGFSQVAFKVSGNITVDGTLKSGEQVQIIVEQSAPSADISVYIATTNSSGYYEITDDFSPLASGSLQVTWQDCNDSTRVRENNYSAASADFTEDFDCTTLATENLYLTIYTRDYDNNPVPNQNVTIELYTPSLTLTEAATTDANGFLLKNYKFINPTAGYALVYWDDCNGKLHVDSVPFDTQGAMQVGSYLMCHPSNRWYLVSKGDVIRDGQPVNDGNIVATVYDASGNMLETKTDDISNGFYWIDFLVDQNYSGTVKAEWTDACGESIIKIDTILIAFERDTLREVRQSFECNTGTAPDSMQVTVFGLILIDGNASYPDYVIVKISDDNNMYVEEFVNTNANGEYSLSKYLPHNYQGNVVTLWDPCDGEFYPQTTYIDGSNQTNSVEHNYTCSTNTNPTIYGYVLEYDSSAVDMAEVYLYEKRANGNVFDAIDTFYVTPNYAGRYEFDVEIGKVYLTKAAPISGNGYIPTYHYHESHWNHAFEITPNSNNYSYDISLLLEGPGNGNGSANGSVAEQDRVGLPYYIMNAIITDELDNSLYTAEVDELGDFSFTGLPNGVYKLSIDYPGFISEAITIRIDDENQSIDNVLFEVGEETVVSDIENVAFSLQELRIFPNPAKNSITISLKEPITGMLELRDGLGRMVQNISINTQSTIVMDINNIPTGVYFINLVSDTSVITKQVIKY